MKKHFFTSLVGAIVLGATIGIFASPIVTTNSTASDDNREEVTTAISQASKSVIGVLNIKKGQEDNLVETGSGSGVVYKKSGGAAYIFTNHHVIEDAHFVEVSLEDGQKLEAEVLGSDKLADLAVLKVDSENIPTTAKVGQSDKLKRGETVFAIGSPLGLEFYGTVTRGIVSATERAIPVDLNEDGVYDWQTDVIQTDAAINPGNSGGALINRNGEVIGINSIKIVEDAVEGIGLAIPISTAMPIIAELEKTGKVSRAYMGVQIRSLQDISGYHQDLALELPSVVTEGVCLLSVEEGSPADVAGLKQYDVVTAIDGKKVDNVIAFRKQLYSKKPKETMELTFYRADEQQEVTVTLIEQR